MQTLQLNIHQDDNYNFFVLFDTLSKIEKNIWNLAVWWTKTKANAYPNQETIARRAKCGRKHVNRTFAKFKKWGWLSLGWRGKNLSKTLLIPRIYQMIDVVKREYFARVEVTSKVTHSYSSNRRDTSRQKNGFGFSRKAEEPKVLQIPDHIQSLDLPLEAKLKLSLVGQNIYEETKHQLQRKIGTGWKPANYLTYFVGTAINMAKDLGFPIAWKDYYHTLKQKTA